MEAVALLRFDGLLTRNVKDSGSLFPDLRLERP